MASLWLRSRLSTEDNEFNDTLLTVTWWQPLPMRVLPLTFMPQFLSHRLHRGSHTTRCNAAAWWRQISIRRPSDRRISQACGDYQLVYLRTTNVHSAIDLKSRLRQHPLYHQFYVFTIFPFTKDVWEVLFNRQGADHFKTCAEGCQCVIESKYQPGLPTELPLSFVNRFDSYMRAQERLVARAVFVQLIARDGQELHSQVASVYCQLVDLYRCYSAYENLYMTQAAPIIEALSPGWSGVVGCNLLSATAL